MAHESDQVVVEFALTQAEFRSAFQQGLLPRPIIKRTFWSLALTLGLSLVLVLFTAGGDQPIFLGGALVVIIFAILGLVYFPIQFFYRLPNRLYKTDTPAGQHVTIRFDRDGMSMTRPESTTEFAWSQVKSISRSRDFLFIWQGESTGHIIPRRVLRSEDESLIGAFAEPWVASSDLS